MDSFVNKLIKEKNFEDKTPGLKTTDYERIIKALDKLWVGIHKLGQNRSDNKQDFQTSNNKLETDLSIVDINQKYVALQLKYVRDIVHKKRRKLLINGSSNIKNKEKSEAAPCQLDQSLDLFPVKLNDKHTQTIEIETVSKSVDVSLEDQENETNSRVYKNEYSTANNVQKKNCMTVTNENVVKNEDKMEIEAPTLDQKFSTLKADKLTVPPHCYMNLSYIPFILGTSTSESHSLVANLQSIIGLMKTHNSLCPGYPFSHGSNQHQNALNQQIAFNYSNNSQVPNLRKRIKALANELSALTEKGDKLKEELNNPQCVSSNDVLKQEYLDVIKEIESVTKEFLDIEKLLNSGNKPMDKGYQSLPGSSKTQLDHKKNTSEICKKHDERGAKESSLNKIELKYEPKKTVNSKSNDVAVVHASNTYGIRRRKLMLTLREIKLNLQSNDQLSWT